LFFYTLYSIDYSISIEEAGSLKKCTEAFLRNVKKFVEEDEYDLAIFNLEQYCQLMLKYIILI